MPAPITQSNTRAPLPDTRHSRPSHTDTRRAPHLATPAPITQPTPSMKPASIAHPTTRRHPRAINRYQHDTRAHCTADTRHALHRATRAPPPNTKRDTCTHRIADTQHAPQSATRAPPLKTRATPASIAQPTPGVHHTTASAHTPAKRTTPRPRHPAHRHELSSHVPSPSRGHRSQPSARPLWPRHPVIGTSRAATSLPPRAKQTDT